MAGASSVAWYWKKDSKRGTMNTLTNSVLFLLAAGIGMAQTFSDSGWVLQNPLPTPTLLHGLAVLDNKNAVAVGEAGTILRTTDAGTTWTGVTSGTTNTLYAVAFTDANTG